MNGVSITRLDLINGTRIPKPGTNISMVVDLSVKNPNTASFKYGNTTTAIFYNGGVVGEARGPPGIAKARKTMRMNLTVEIATDRIEMEPDMGAGSGLMRMRSYSKVGGRVKIMGLVKRHVTVKMNCTVVVDVSNRAIKEQKCKRNLDF